MGMAASQARYLALTARKTNVEYEGQQLNQERVVLANRTADLFNQMLTAEVPKCPDSNDFTKVQYSWSDGYNDAVISDYYQLSTADEEYNYVVTSYHYENEYTGTRKLMNDPKIQAYRDLQYTYSQMINQNLLFLAKSMQYNPEDDIYTLVDDRRISKEFKQVDDAGDVRLELDAIYNRAYKDSAHAFELDDNGNYIYTTNAISNLYEGYEPVVDEGAEREILDQLYGRTTTVDASAFAPDGANYIYTTYDDFGNPVTVTYEPVDMTNPEMVQLLKDTYKSDYDPSKTYYYDSEYGTFVVGDDLTSGGGDVVVRNQDDGTVYYSDGVNYMTGPIGLVYEHVNLDDEESDLVQLLKQTYKTEFDKDKDYYYNAETGTFFVDEGIEQFKHNMGMPPEVTIRKQFDGTIYYTDGERYITRDELEDAMLALEDDNISSIELLLKQAIEKMEFTNFQAVGNCVLHELSAEDYADEAVKTELDQIRNDMKDPEKGNRISSANLEACFDPITGEYLGGIYTFKLHNTVYYTTVYDLEASARSAFEDNNQERIADNNIDPQLEKLAYYKASYLKTKIEDTSKALLETDGKGRFTSVRFADDSTVYTLNVETITDEDAYNDAMNQYFYNQEKYDKTIRDINAKTELIQAEDRTLELRLKQLDTEQNALQTEMDAVKKVISKNVEMTFKTFAG